MIPILLPCLIICSLTLGLRVMYWFRAVLLSFIPFASRNHRKWCVSIVTIIPSVSVLYFIIAFLILSLFAFYPSSFHVLVILSYAAFKDPGFTVIGKSGTKKCVVYCHLGFYWQLLFIEYGVIAFLDSLPDVLTKFSFWATVLISLNLL